MEPFVSRSHVPSRYERGGDMGDVLGGDEEGDDAWLDEDGRVPEAYVASFTGEGRTRWAEARERFFSDGLNKRSLDMIETAAFVVSLDDEEAPKDDTGRGRALIHGNGRNRWFDKSLCLVAFKDGRCGLNVEHSWADAPVAAHLWEYALTGELIDAPPAGTGGGGGGESGIGESGNGSGSGSGWFKGHTRSGTAEAALSVDGSLAKSRKMAPPHRLRWALTGNACRAAKMANAASRQLIDDFDLCVTPHKTYVLNGEEVGHEGDERERRETVCAATSGRSLVS
jgi:hypothetical protein